jgi:hypothetical protein
MKLSNIIKTKKHILLSVVLVTFTLFSCQKDFGDINKSWDAKVYEPTIPALFNEIAASLQEPGGTGNILTSWVYQNSQQAAIYAASGYRMDNFSATYWNNYYKALANYRKLEELISKSAEPTKLSNIQAMAKTLMAYKTLYATLMYGDMPYSQASRAFLEGSDFLRPKYDTQAEIFKSALNDLKWAVDNLSTSTDKTSLKSGDVLLGNDITMWVKFANSLRLRYALVLQAKDAATSNAAIAEALAKPLLAPGEDISLQPTKITNYLNDRGGWYRGNSYVRMGSTMWNAMSSSNAVDGSGIYDLRCKIFFEPNSSKEWTPFPQAPSSTTPTEIGNSGDNDPYAEARLTTYEVKGKYLYAPLNVYYVNDKTIPRIIIAGHEISLLKAEVYNRGIGGVAANAANAKTFYEEGVTESVKYWYKTANGSGVWSVGKPDASPTAAELDKMLKNPGVAYSSTAATGLTQIYKQLWIALFHQPIEGWTLARRTNYATPNVALTTSSPGYNIFRIIYPQSEIDGNYDNWSAITGGTDSPNKKPWFMP